MIAYLTGTLLTHTKDGAVILCGTVGYELIGTWLGRIVPGSPVEAWVYEYLENESIPRQIACQTQEARELFLQFLGVSGVGPKMANRIVDTIPAPKLKEVISAGDISTLSSVKGLGKKTAQKIVLELGKILVTGPSSAHASIIDALSGLKFTPREIQAAIDATDLAGLNESQSLSAVLRNLGGRK